MCAATAGKRSGFRGRGRGGRGGRDPGRSGVVAKGHVADARICGHWRNNAFNKATAGERGVV